MKERPILFQGEMVRALLAGTKTQTRRLVKFPLIDRDALCELAGNELAGSREDTLRNSPYGRPGDRLWVKETFLPWVNTKDGSFSHVAAFRADGYELEAGEQWRPSIFMPRAGARIMLEIVDVRVERLCKISEEDARAEGGPRILGFKEKGGRQHGFSSYRDWYRALWDGINAKPKPIYIRKGVVSHYVSYPWGGEQKLGVYRGKTVINTVNPCVWVVEFRRVEA